MGATCRHCKGEIARGASVCPACGREQSLFFGSLFHASRMSFVASLAMIVFALLELRSAGDANRAANAAIEDANISLVEIEATLEDARRIERDARARAIELRIESNRLLIERLQQSGGRSPGTAKHARVQRLERDVDALRAELERFDL